jgi:hypothetical protein
VYWRDEVVREGVGVVVVVQIVKATLLVVAVSVKSSVFLVRIKGWFRSVLGIFT